MKETRLSRLSRLSRPSGPSGPPLASLDANADVPETLDSNDRRRSTAIVPVPVPVPAPRAVPVPIPASTSNADSTKEIQSGLERPAVMVNGEPTLEGDIVKADSTEKTQSGSESSALDERTTALDNLDPRTTGRLELSSKSGDTYRDAAFGISAVSINVFMIMTSPLYDFLVKIKELFGVLGSAAEQYEEAKDSIGPIAGAIGRAIDTFENQAKIAVNEASEEVVHEMKDITQKVVSDVVDMIINRMASLLQMAYNAVREVINCNTRNLLNELDEPLQAVVAELNSNIGSLVAQLNAAVEEINAICDSGGDIADRVTGVIDDIGGWVGGIFGRKLLAETCLDPITVSSFQAPDLAAMAENSALLGDLSPSDILGFLPADVRNKTLDTVIKGVADSITNALELQVCDPNGTSLSNGTSLLNDTSLNSSACFSSQFEEKFRDIGEYIANGLPDGPTSINNILNIMLAGQIAILVMAGVTPLLKAFCQKLTDKDEHPYIYKVVNFGLWNFTLFEEPKGMDKKAKVKYRAKQTFYAVAPLAIVVVVLLGKLYNSYDGNLADDTVLEKMDKLFTSMLLAVSALQASMDFSILDVSKVFTTLMETVSDQMGDVDLVAGNCSASSFIKAVTEDKSIGKMAEFASSSSAVIENARRGIIGDLEGQVNISGIVSEEIHRQARKQAEGAASGIMNVNLLPLSLARGVLNWLFKKMFSEDTQEKLQILPERKKMEESEIYAKRIMEISQSNLGEEHKIRALEKASKHFIETQNEPKVQPPAKAMAKPLSVHGVFSNSSSLPRNEDPLAHVLPPIPTQTRLG